MIENLNKKSHLIIMQPVGRRVIIPYDKSLLEATQSAGVELNSICGGIGSCGGCKVRLMDGLLTFPTLIEEQVFTLEELASGFRLACQAKPQSDVKLYIPPESLTTPQRLQLEGVEINVPSDPVITFYDLNIPPPNLEDLRSDTNRAATEIKQVSGLNQIYFNYHLLTNISEALRQSSWQITAAIRNDQVISIYPKYTEKEENYSFLGLAVDIGTTKLAAYLVNLRNGQTVAKAGAMNPQIAYGEDVISRISFANRNLINGSNSNRKLLQSKLIEVLNEMIQQMLSETKIYYQDQIIDAVIVGNTAMHHLFAGFPVRQLGEAPYVPSITDSVYISSFDLGLNIAESAAVYLPSNVAGYVGADHVSMLLASVFNERANGYGRNVNSANIIAIDIGTNTEVSLISKGKIVCCSCASGPAFEGAHIKDGMRAAPGAIEKIKIENDTVNYKTIENLPPIGICGSGILDAIAEMCRNGIVDFRGALIADKLNVRQRTNELEFVITPATHSGHNQDITVTRKDINEIQLAKGAIRAGLEILMKENGLSANQIDKFIIAGAFGTYIDIDSAIRVGMFPCIPKNKFMQVGNAAGTGARNMLVSKSQRKLAEEISRQIEYIELSNYSGFTNEFSKALFFPK